MELISDIGQATAVAGSVSAELEALRGAAFWKLGDQELLTLAETLERVGRLVFAVQVSWMIAVPDEVDAPWSEMHSPLLTLTI